MTTTQIYAQDLSDILSICDSISKLAGVVMEARQNGTPKTEMMIGITPILNDPKVTPEHKNRMEEVINNAYQYPIHPSSRRDLQSLAIDSFSIKSREECLEKFGFPEKLRMLTNLSPPKG